MTALSTPIPAPARGRRTAQQTVRRYALPVAALVATWVYFYVTTGTFRGDGAIFPVLQGFSLLGLVALGVGMTMLAGELDLSAASVAGIGAIMAIKTGGTGLVPCLLIVTAGGVVFGALQGFVIAKLKINSLVFTVGTMILLGGVGYLITHSQPVLLANLNMANPLLERWVVITPGIIVAAICFALAAFFLAYLKWGREIYAIGGGRQEAKAAGVAASRPIVVSFACSAGLAALAGGMAALIGGSATPDNFSDLLLTSVSAALIGGVSLYGGRGTVLNIALGVAVVSTISSGVAAKGAQEYTTDIVTGLLLMASISTEYAARRIGEARSRAGYRRAHMVESASDPG